jgi:hypothetical protein
MKHVLGPAPSCRLGRSLGIDPMSLKTCKWNCVCCQLGRTVPLVHERRKCIPHAAVLGRVQADAIHTNLPTRPPGEPWVGPPGQEGLMRALAILGESAEVVHPADGAFAIRPEEDLVEAIPGVISRHPMRLEELKAALVGVLPAEGARAPEAGFRQIFQQLQASGKAQCIKRYGSTFYAAAGSRFAKGQAARHSTTAMKRGRQA